MVVVLLVYLLTMVIRYNHERSSTDPSGAVCVVLVCVYECQTECPSQEHSTRRAANTPSHLLVEDGRRRRRGGGSGGGRRGQEEKGQQEKGNLTPQPQTSALSNLVSVCRSLLRRPTHAHTCMPHEGVARAHSSPTEVLFPTENCVT